MKRHFRAESAGWKPITQSAQDPDLPGVTERVAVRVEAKTGHEPHGDAEPTHLLHADVAEESAFERST